MKTKNTCHINKVDNASAEEKNHLKVNHKAKFNYIFKFKRYI